tara:strand:- start:1412 stop:1906 length:495 start_codon:yes stop_codon:yes gene_type:complete
MYRYQFSEHVVSELKEFASTHKYDDIPVFKEHWNNWTLRHSGLINVEESVLKLNGYIGCILTKMYKSVRYYYKDRSLDIRKPKERRVYIPLSREIREGMDEHISRYINKDKPSTAYNHYIIEFKETLFSERIKLMNGWGLDEKSCDSKIKKTYKNRYFALNKRG